MCGATRGHEHLRALMISNAVSSHIPHRTRTNSPLTSAPVVDPEAWQQSLSQCVCMLSSLFRPRPILCHIADLRPLITRAGLPPDTPLGPSFLFGVSKKAWSSPLRNPYPAIWPRSLMLLAPASCQAGSEMRVLRSTGRWCCQRQAA